jgi:hypothetical protein
MYCTRDKKCDLYGNLFDLECKSDSEPLPSLFLDQSF